MEARWAILVATCIVVSVAWAVKLLNLLWLRPRNLEKFLRRQGLHGNPYRPFLGGDLRDMIRAIKAEQPRSIHLSDHTSPHVFAYYIDILNKYGKTSFFWLGPWAKLNIVDPELIKEILRKPDVFQKPFPDIVKAVSGGLVVHEGEKWAKHRKIINPAFHLHNLKNMVPAIRLSCSDMISKLKSAVSSSQEGWSEIDLWPVLQDLTGDVISRTAFGISHEQGTKIFQLQRERQKNMLQLLQYWIIPGWRYLPTKLNKRVKAMNKEIDSLLRGIIEKRQKTVHGRPSDDLLGILMESNARFIEECGDKKKGMSIEDVIQECSVFYLAGSETTAGLLVWAMVLLCQHPEWQSRAREEVIRVFGDSEPSFEGLNQLKNVNMILQEALRLYPALPIMSRYTMETVKLGNMTIPAGVHLSLLVGLLHRDPDIWGDDANEFRPQRFAEGVVNAAAKIQSSLVSFSSGPRVCIGQNFAMIEAKMVVAMIVRASHLSCPHLICMLLSHLLLCNHNTVLQ